MDDFHHIALDKDSEYLSKIKHLNLGQVVLFSQEETEYFLTHKTQNETDDVLKKDFKHTIVTLSNSNNERRSIPRPKTEIVVEKNGNVFLLAQLGSFELKYGLINTNARIKIEIAIRRYDKSVRHVLYAFRKRDR